MELEGENELLEPAHKRRRDTGDRGRCSKDASKRVNSKKLSLQGHVSCGTMATIFYGAIYASL